MKNLIFLCILFLMVGAETAGQSLENITSIMFTKQSRGYLDEVVISRDSVQGYIENHREPESTKDYANGVDHDQWAKLMLALKDVPLESIDGLQSPTMNRAHDGALQSTITISFKDDSTITHSFDDENPHPDLQPLLDVILEFRPSITR